MPHIHYETEMTDAVGTTALALEPVATLRTSAAATDLIAFVTEGPSTGVRTADEATDGEFVVNAQTLAKDLLRFQKGASDGGGPAANIQSYVEYPKWFPFLPDHKVVKDKSIIFQYDAVVPEPTAEVCALACLVYSEGTYPKDVISNVGILGLTTRHKWSESTTEPDLGNAVAEAFPDDITVPGWVKEITAIGIKVSLDAAPTAGEHLCGYVEIGGTIPGTYPMKVPMPAIGASLGAPVGNGIWCYEFILPMWIEHTSEADATLTFTGVIDQVLTATAAVEVTLYGR